MLGCLRNFSCKNFLKAFVPLLGVCEEWNTCHKTGRLVKHFVTNEQDD